MSLDDLIKRQKQNKKGGFGGRGGRGGRGGFRGGRGNQNLVPRMRQGGGIFKRREDSAGLRGGRFRGNRGGLRNQRVRLVLLLTIFFV